MENVPTPEVHEQEVSIEPRVRVVAPYSEDVVTVPKSQLKDALEQDYTIATPGQVKEHVKREKYGTATQRAITAAEGLAEGAIPFGGASAFETKVLGVNPEDIRAREEVNPVIKGTAGVAGLVGSQYIPVVGAASLYSKAGKALTQIPKVAKVLGEGATTGSKIAQGAAKGAFETALFSGGEEIAKKFKEDPEQSAYTAAANIGLGTLFGGMGGASLSAIGAGASSLARSLVPEQWVSELEKPALEAGNLDMAVKHADHISDAKKDGFFSSLRKRKANADQIEQSSKNLNITPHPSMVLDDKPLQWTTDALLNGPPTVASNAMREEFGNIYGDLEKETTNILGAKSPYSTAQYGEILTDNITKKINESLAPAEARYNFVKNKAQVIPLIKNPSEYVELAAKGIPEYSRGSKDPAMRLLRDAVEEVKNLKTVDDLRSYQTELNGRLSHAATPNEVRLMANVKDILKDLEEKSVDSLAERMAKTPAEIAENQAYKVAMKEANSIYKKEITKVSTLLEGLGKGRVYGKQDALRYIKEHLTAEQLVKKLSTKGDSAFRKFLSNEFPAEANTIALYQKNLMREAATEKGVLNVNKFLSAVEKLEPEIKEQIFNKEELAKIKDIKNVFESFPPAVNGSRSGHVIALREHWEGPENLVRSNLRDAAMQRFIKQYGENKKEDAFQKLINATVKGEQMLKKGVKSLFLKFNNKGTDIPVLMLPVVTPKEREKVKKHIDEYSQHPERLMDLHNNPGIPQEYAQAFGQISASALQYLSSLKPKEDRMSPFDAKPVVNKVDEDKYNRAIDIAEQPYSILEHIKDGTIIPQDVATLHNIYPKLYDMIAERLTDEMMEHVSKEKSIPYKTMIGISMFMGKPMDSTMTPMAIQANQPKGPEQGPKDAQPQGSKTKHSMTALNKLPGQYQTPDQARSASRGQS